MTKESQRVIIYITERMFRLFFSQKVQEKFEKDWNKRDRTNRTSVPHYDSIEYTVDMSDFLIAEPRIKEIKRLKSKSKDDNYNVKYFVYDRLKKKKWQGNVDERLISIYAVYADEKYSSFMDFIEDDDFFKKSKERLEIREEQRGIWKNNETPNEIKTIEYKVFYYSVVKKVTSHYILEIDISKLNDKNSKKNALLIPLKSSEESDEGHARITGDFLKIEFLRHRKGEASFPLSMLFYVDRGIDGLSKLPVLIGTYMASSIASKKNVLSGDIILCQTSFLENDADADSAENIKSIIKIINRKLSFKQSANVVSIDQALQFLSEEGALQLLENIGSMPDSYDKIKSMIGKYECFSIFPDDDGCIYRFHLTIDENFVTSLKAMQNKYNGKVKVESKSLFIEFSKQSNFDNNSSRNIRLDSSMIISTQSTRPSRGKIFIGHCVGVRQNLPTSSFPVVFLKIEDEFMTSRKYKSNELINFLKERPKYYIHVLKELFIIENERSEMTQSLFEANKHLLT